MKKLQVFFISLGVAMASLLTSVGVNIFSPIDNVSKNVATVAHENCTDASTEIFGTDNSGIMPMAASFNSYNIKTSMDQYSVSVLKDNCLNLSGEVEVIKVRGMVRPQNQLSLKINFGPFLDGAKYTEPYMTSFKFSTIKFASSYSSVPL